MREQSNTRRRIQEVALELFTEQGYEATSLREIAERLGVTKAALYYHFKTKEEIIGSLIDDRLTLLRELVDWAQAQPRTPDLRREVVRRYAAQLQDVKHSNIMRFAERNRTALRDQSRGEGLKEAMMNVFAVLVEPDDPLPVKIQSALSIMSMHVGLFLFDGDDKHTDDELSAAALEVALGMIDTAESARQRA
ncbi:TetR/AcrR family transcriptional regulator [Virgisporangium aurantiacum]|uniref:TetR family transcriptional regulator n=1 Tax=Virgisporangium aurantiacum TaxID=175570 RepID=A0A8J4DXH0_9ACTN|nr:TetR/AcrR family transcriptional regulator [Virgisporangium aurantiacum]GIJ54535.1 TetR family transcriptional regulator [Virgisporangium aurantiacum]